MEDKDLEEIHQNIHALRLIKEYKPSLFESKVAMIIMERYKTQCEECNKRLDTIKNAKPTKNFFQKFFEGG